MSIFDRIKGALESVGGKAKTALLSILEPKVHCVITENVQQFQANSLEALPNTCEVSLKEQSGANAVAWAVDKALGDRTSDLVGRLVELMRPGITTATSGLSGEATELIMARVRDALDIDGDSEDEAEAGAQLEEGGEQLPRRSTLKRIGGLMFNLDERLPEVETSARDAAHPLFVRLQGAVWDLVPSTLTTALGELLDGNASVVEGKVAEEEAGGGGDGGLFGGLLDHGRDALVEWARTRSGPALQQGLDSAIGLVEGPMRALITRLVDELEDNSMSAAFREVREQLAAYHLIEGETQQA